MKLNNISKAYDGKIVLDHLSMEIEDGVTTCIMAPSGAGKTTLLRILMGLEKADGGCVEGLEGMRFSAVFQEERLCEYMSAVENIRLVTPRLERQAVLRELEKLGLGGSGMKPVSSLSGGQRQRVNILRALLAEYDVLFLDEPFKGLDDVLRKKVIAYVKDKTAGKTVLFVTHDKSEALAMEAKIIGCGSTLLFSEIHF